MLVIALALATPTGALVYSAAGSSIFAARNLLASLPAVCLLLGALFAAAPLRLRLVAVPLVLAALLVGTLRSLDSDNRRPPWNDVADYLDAHAAPGDPIIEINTFGTRSPIGQRAVLSNVEIYFDRPHRFYSTPATESTVLERVVGARRVYVVKNQLPGLEGAPPPPLIDDALDLKLAAARPAHVLTSRRHHLAEEAEREQLDPDHDQQHAEQQQRPPADRLAAEDLDRGQVGGYHDADQHQHQADAAEQVQRPVLVAPDEQHGEQVEQPAPVARAPVARDAVPPRPVVDRQLRDPPATLVGQQRDVAVQLAVQLERARAIASVRLQPAVEVVQAQPGQPPGHRVEHA